MVRAKIQASHIVRRLQLAFDGKIELSKVQVEIGRLLLAKSLPDLIRTEMTGANGESLQTTVEVKFTNVSNGHDG